MVLEDEAERDRENGRDDKGGADKDALQDPEFGICVPGAWDILQFHSYKRVNHIMIHPEQRQS